MKKVVSILLIISSLFVLSASLCSYADNGDNVGIENTEKFQKEKEKRNIKINVFLANNKKYFPQDKLASIKSILKSLSDSELELVLNMDFTSPAFMVLVSIFGGEFGIDRFIAGDIGKGLLKLAIFYLTKKGILTGLLFGSGLISGSLVMTAFSPLLSLLPLGAFWLHDIFTASGRTKQANYEYLLEALSKNL